ncbi:MAG: hypothetical protein PHE55_15960 [Methylococcaceae bacterium]|nr:hypothetical protein [Methylococcaceae bacterium]
MEKIAKSQIFLIYLLFITFLIVILFANYGSSASVDLGTHYTLANKISSDYGIGNGYQGSVGGMRDYPPLAHWFAAIVTVVTHSTLLAMNIVILVSFAIAYYFIGYLLVSVNISALLVCAGILFLVLKNTIFPPIIGSEIVGNFFYPHFVSQGFVFLILFALYRYEIQLLHKIGFLICAILIGFCIHPTLPLVLFGSSIVVIIFESHKKLDLAKLIVILCIYILAVITLFFILPYNRLMLAVADSNGHLGFDFLTNTKLDISVVAYVFVGLSFIVAIISLAFLKSADIVRDSKSRAMLFASAILLSVSGLTTFQFFLLSLGKGSAYSVKKFFFCLFTFFIILISMWIGRLVCVVNNSIVIPNAVSLKSCHYIGYILFPLLALGVSMLTFKNPDYSVTEFNKIQTQVRYINEYYNTENGWHNTIAQMPVSKVLNYILTVGDLGFPVGVTANNVLSGNISFMDTENYNVMTSIDFDGGGVIYKAGKVVLVNKQGFYNSTYIKGKTVDFNTFYSTKYLKSGFSTPEVWGVWSNGMESIIEINVGKSAGTKDYFLQFQLQPWIVPGHQSFDVDVFVNDVKVDKWTFNSSAKSPETKSILFSYKLIGDSNVMQVRFHYSNLSSPKALNMSSDARELSLGFLSFKLDY